MRLMEHGYCVTVKGRKYMSKINQINEFFSEKLYQGEVDWIDKNPQHYTNDIQRSKVKVNILRRYLNGSVRKWHDSKIKQIDELDKA